MWAVALVNASESVWDTLEKKISVDVFYNLQLWAKKLRYLREKDIATAQYDIIQRAKNCGWRNQ